MVGIDNGRHRVGFISYDCGDLRVLLRNQLDRILPSAAVNEPTWGIVPELVANEGRNLNELDFNVV